MNRFTICCLISNRSLKDGASFSSTDWPLHITIAGSYLDSTNLAITAEQLEQIAHTVQPFDITVGKIDYLGPTKETAVNLIEPNPGLSAILGKVIVLLESHDARFRNPDFFTLDKYKPHSTIQKTEKAITGSTLHIGHFSLVQHEKDNIAHQRTILRTFNLGDTTQ